MQSLLEMKGITKRFPGIIANDNIHLTLYAGEIHALLGENGAGKSTLMNILTGIYAPNEGEIFYCGAPVRMRDPRDAARLGIRMVHQHFKLVETLTVAENITLAAAEQKGFLLHRKQIEARIAAYSESLHLKIDPAAYIWQLSVGEQQRVEIVKQLYCGANVLILDEPTSVLTPQETKELFLILRKMADAGKAILFITHKLSEVMSYVDRITVLRNGKSVGTVSKWETTKETLIKMMVGREVLPLQVAHAQIDEGHPVLQVKQLSANNDKGNAALKEVSFTLHRGEILGIAGISGNGQKELAETVTGLRRIRSGQLLFDGADATDWSAKRLRQNGVSYIPEDRMGIGLVGQMDTFENVLLRHYDDLEFSLRGIIRKKAIRDTANALVARYDIKSAGCTKPVSYMSGGNLQKLLLSRELIGNVKLVVAAYPVHGVDVAATDTIHQMLLQQRDAGAAILLISEDLDELFEMSDRIGVFYEGRLMEILRKEQYSYARVGFLMSGVHADSAKSAAEEVAPA